MPAAARTKGGRAGECGKGDGEEAEEERAGR